MPSIRTFIAFDTPEPIRREMSIIQSELKKANTDVKWEQEYKFHVTIKFLGDVEESILPSVLASIESAIKSYSPFEVVYKTVGAFPNIQQPRIVWIGCENADNTLQKLKNKMDGMLQPFGFEIENRAFHPHITLGRIKGTINIKNLTSILEKITFQPQNTTITELVVMKSVLRREGSEYSVMQSIKLH